MYGLALSRFKLIFLTVSLILSVVQADGACATEFKNVGNRSVHRLFFIANGYAYAGPEKGDVHGKAKEAALRFGLEQCRQYLAKRGLSASVYRFKNLSNGQPVRVHDSKNMAADFQGKGLVAVRIVGEVQYEFSADATSLPQILSVELASDKRQYRAGEHLYFSLRGNMKFYGSLLDLNPVGELIQLLPNGTRKQSTFAANVAHVFPDRKSGDNFDLRVGPPFGLEKIHIMMSDKEIAPVLNAEKVGEGFGVVERDLSWAFKEMTWQIVRQLKEQPVHKTFYCMQVYENGVDLTTSQSGYEH